MKDHEQRILIMIEQIKQAQDKAKLGLPHMAVSRIIRKHLDEVYMNGVDYAVRYIIKKADKIPSSLARILHGLQNNILKSREK